MTEEKSGEKTASKNKIDRRDLLQGMATLPVLGVFGYAVYKQHSYERAALEANAAGTAVAEDIPALNIAQIGVGAQGQVLRDDLLKIPNIRIRAVCDIWTDYNLRQSVGMYKRYGFEVNGYEDYREMLDKEKDLDAVIIASPDFWHARHTIDCLKAGLNVYCEKEMAENLDDAREMIATARETGKLLQIGHQRRSNPRYLYCYGKLLEEAKLPGRIVTVNGQWNRAVQEFLGYPKRYEIPVEKLKKYGFQSMEQFRNWRWFKGLGGGPIVDIGSHQIDIFSWFLNSNPKSVMASGGKDYYPDREWYDTVMVIYEYETPQGPARAYYQTQTTNSSMGYFEKFMGDQGTLVISESNANFANAIYREVSAPPWDEWVRKGYISAPKIAETPQQAEGAILDVRESASPDEHKIPVTLTEPYHTPHLKNFFKAIAGQEPLNCPGEVGLETAAAVLKVNKAIEAGGVLEFRPEEFKI